MDLRTYIFKVRGYIRTHQPLAVLYEVGDSPSVSVVVVGIHDYVLFGIIYECLDAFLVVQNVKSSPSICRRRWVVHPSNMLPRLPDKRMTGHGQDRCEAYHSPPACAGQSAMRPWLTRGSACQAGKHVCLGQTPVNQSHSAS